MRIDNAQQPTLSTAPFVQRYPMLTFAGLSIAFSWIPLILAAVLPYIPLALLTAAAPLLALFLVRAVGREDNKVRSLFRLPAGIQWYIALLLPALWGVILTALHQLFPDGTMDYPVVPLGLFTTALVIIFETSERVAWRAYVLPKLLAHYSPSVASLIISGWVLVIYLPLYVTGALVDNSVFPVRPAFIASALICFVWLWHHLHVMIPLKQHGFLWTFLRAIGRGALALLVALFALLSGAYLYQAITSSLDERGFPPPGQVVTVDGHSMHVLCTGQGSPTVILESGAFSFSAEWYTVQKQVEQTNRVCSYDRAGNGWSDAVPGPRDGLTLARELHALLASANIPGPYVLAGHSLGGVLDVIYASQYPADVLGIILVDPAVPTKFPDRSSYDQFVSQNQSAYSVMAALARLGLVRPIVSGEFQVFGYPASVIPELTALKARIQSVDTWDAEVQLAQWDLYQQFQVAANLDKLPVVVLWASHPEITAGTDRQRLEAIWALLPVSSSNRVIRVVEGASHGSIIGQPEYAAQINQAILDVITSTRTGTLLKQR